MSKINLALIRIDGGTQSRVALNLDTVADYREALKAGTELPPVMVFNDGTDQWMADGFHRYFAYKEEGRVSMPAWIRPGTLREAILFSLGANHDHGLRRTNDDKRRAVKRMLEDAEWSLMSDRQIAEHCNVSHTFVSGVRNPKPPAPPAPKKEPKAPKGAGTPTGDGAAPPAGGNVATAPAQPPAPPEKTAAEKTAEEAHGGSDLVELLEETQADLAAAQKQIAAAKADDLKAEAMKWQRIAEIAQRRQSELMDDLKKRDTELQRMSKIIARIGKAVGEEDPTKLAATVELFVRTAKVAA
jgi:hypothetical protein